MSTNTLYSLLTDLTPTGKVCLNEKLKMLFSARLSAEGISAPVANAMATVMGGDKAAWFRLWLVKKNPAVCAPPDAAGYAADDRSRYFFEYGPADSDAVFFLEYSFVESFELLGLQRTEDGWHEMKVSDAGTKEALAAMLFAIMLQESNTGSFPVIAAQFFREYRNMFTAGCDQGMNIIKALFGALRDNVDPKKEAECDVPLRADNRFLNTQNGRLKKLMQNEKIGYTTTDKAQIFFACNLQTILCKEGGKSEDILSNFVILEGILTTAARMKLVKPQANQYPLHPNRTYDAEDASRLPAIPDWYVPAPAVMQIAKSVVGSAIFQKPFRNVMMRGPAGSGKTEGAKALAGMFGSPYGVLTGHAEMEFFDLTSNLFPNTDSAVKSDAELYEYLLYALRDSGLTLPSFIEIASMPDVVYQQISGTKNDDAGEAECFAALVTKLMQVCKKDANLFGGETSKFKVIHSDLTMGFQKGWLVELQEMNTILKPGVLVGLNNILEHGQLRLPTGEIINRHPDTVIVFTQNVGYAGTTDGNQSVYSRIEVKCDLDHPTEEEMIARIRMHVPEIAEADCRTIVQTILCVQENCSIEIEGGSVGTREAINWAKMTVLLDGDMREAAELTLLPSVGEDADNIQLVRSNIYQSIAEMK